MKWSQPGRFNRLCVIVSAKRCDVLIGKYDPCICQNKDCGSYKGAASLYAFQAFQKVGSLGRVDKPIDARIAN